MLDRSCLFLGVFQYNLCGKDDSKANMYTLILRLALGSKKDSYIAEILTFIALRLKTPLSTKNQ